MPRARDAALAQQREKLAASAADVEHVAGALEDVQVLGDALPDVVLRSPELILEADVLVAVERVELAALTPPAAFALTGAVATATPFSARRVISRFRFCAAWCSTPSDARSSSCAAVSAVTAASLRCSRALSAW